MLLCKIEKGLPFYGGHSLSEDMWLWELPGRTLHNATGECVYGACAGRGGVEKAAKTVMEKVQRINMGEENRYREK